MKRLAISLIILTAVTFTLVRCKLEGDNYTRSVVKLNLTSWALPDEAIVSTPFNLTLNSCIENSCLSDIQFRIVTENGKNYVYAQSIYENSGEDCLPLEICSDSTMAVTISQAGKFYYYFLKENVWNKDSINIVAP
jgi:hypothetical protein